MVHLQRGAIIHHHAAGSYPHPLSMTAACQVCLQSPLHEASRLLLLLCEACCQLLQQGDTRQQ